MQFACNGNDYLVRIDKGEEVLSNLVSLCKQQGIECASVSGIGASDDFTFGIFNTDSKTYVQTDVHEPAEITSIVGNVTTQNGNPYLHLHATFAKEDGSVCGGHLNRAVISVTCELFLHVCKIYTDRVKDDVGVNVISFKE